MATAAPTVTGAGFGDLLNGNAGAALDAQGRTWGAIVAAIGVGVTSAAVQILAFVLLRWRLSRI